MYKTIILIKYICLKIIFLLYFCSTSLAADYSKLPTIKKILFSTDEIHLSCFEDQIYLGIIVYSDEYKSVQFSGWKFEEASIKIDKSSTTQLVKFPVLIDPFELITINLENFNMIINQYESVDINDPSPPEDLLKAIYDKDMFNYFKNIKPSKTSNIDCGVTWAFKIRPIKENEELYPIPDDRLERPCGGANGFDDFVERWHE